MGELRFRKTYYNYRIVEWAPNLKRLRQLKRRVQGPRELYWMYNYKDRTQKLVFPSERHVIKRFRKCNREIVNIYDTDRSRLLDSDHDTYELQEDIKKMESLIRNTRIPKEDRMNKLLKDIYGDPTYPQHWRREPDPVYD